MKILFIGDSITKGTTGVSFVDKIKEAEPSWLIKNMGVDGDTFIKISGRLLEELKLNNDYDYIILEAGYNDIMLPYFNQMSILFRFALNQRLKEGYHPLQNLQSIENQYRQTITAVKEIFNGKIILTTLGCINEYLDFELNETRNEYNHVVKKIAAEYNCIVADVGAKFDEYLSATIQTNYFLNSFWDAVLLDPIQCKKINGADNLSKKRKLQLTIDGVHLNSAGAEIFKEVILEKIN